MTLMSWNPAIDPGCPDEVGIDGSDNGRQTFGCRRGELNGGPGGVRKLTLSWSRRRERHYRRAVV